MTYMVTGGSWAAEQIQCIACGLPKVASQNQPIHSSLANILWAVDNHSFQRLVLTTMCTAVTGRSWGRKGKTIAIENCHGLRKKKRGIEKVLSDQYGRLPRVGNRAARCLCCFLHFPAQKDLD